MEVLILHLIREQRKTIMLQEFNNSLASDDDLDRGPMHEFLVRGDVLYNNT